MDNIKWVFFDIGSTLVNEAKCYEKRFEEAVENTKIPYDEFVNKGIAKPDLRIFEIALEKADCEPQNAVMVGDRLDNDILPANKIGMKTVWIRQGFAKYSAPKKEYEKADFAVDNLNEVLDVLVNE